MNGVVQFIYGKYAGIFANKGRGMEVVDMAKNYLFLWPYRRKVIRLYNEEVITRREFIEFWGSAYGKD